MKKIILPFSMALVGLACNNTGKDSVEKADSINEAKLDTGLNRNNVVIDEASSSFIVRVANSGIAETDMASYVEQNGTIAHVKSFAAMLFHDHSGVNQTVKNLAVQKNITLPAVMSDDKLKAVNDLKAKKGKDLDREFIKVMIKNHISSIELFENAMLDAKDTDIRSFADKTLPTLRAHLDSAKAIEKMHW